MATLREIRKRIRSIKNISQVTRAMQTVSASKMRRAQMLTLGARPYAYASRHVLDHLVGRLTPAQQQRQPLLMSRPVRAIEVVLITANGGLCGGYNHNIIDATMAFIAEQTVPVRLVAVGRKGRDYASRHGLEIVADFDIPDRPSSADVRPIVRVITDDLERGRADQVWLAYTDFVNTLTQRPRLQLLLPVDPAISSVPMVGAPHRRGPDAEPSSELTHRATPDGTFALLLEPDAETLLGPMLRRFIETQVYQAILEAQASEHSARMVAMRNATENALRLIDELTLGYNKARQEAITKELIDIVGGVAALAKRQSNQL